ncbi:MAG: helix-turn-helix domain-containing protein [Verrucomicrobiales bacterium]|nr:helix-turn-helix domain-containing protein [Verrucomicrobiales bacterium]
MARPIRGPDESTYLGRLAARLKALRLKCGYDHKQAAAAITKAGWSVSVPTIYKWEQGRAFPHYIALPYIAKAYGVEPRAILPKE